MSVNLESLKIAEQKGAILAVELERLGFLPPLTVYNAIYEEPEINSLKNGSGQFDTYESVYEAAVGYELIMVSPIGSDKVVVEREKIVDANGNVYPVK